MSRASHGLGTDLVGAFRQWTGDETSDAQAWSLSSQWHLNRHFFGFVIDLREFSV